MYIRTTENPPVYLLIVKININLKTDMFKLT